MPEEKEPMPEEKEPMPEEKEPMSEEKEPMPEEYIIYFVGMIEFSESVTQYTVHSTVGGGRGALSYVTSMRDVSLRRFCS